jgi:hypothetical protein
MLFEDLSVIVDRKQSVFIVKLFLNFLYLLIESYHTSLSFV